MITRCQLIAAQTADSRRSEPCAVVSVLTTYLFVNGGLRSTAGEKGRKIEVERKEKTGMPVL